MEIFLSHSSRDKQTVIKFRELLHKLLNTWIDDERLAWGEGLEESFSSAIKTDVDFLIVFLSNDALDSEWVKKELRWAFEREYELKRTFVLPVVFPDTDKEKVPELLKGRRYLKLEGYKTGDIKKLSDEASDDLFKLIVGNYTFLKSKIDSDRFFVKSYSVSDHPDFTDDAINRINKAKNITMAGLCINLLWKNKIVDMLVERAKLNDANVRLCLSNPEDKEVKERTVEEFCDRNCQGLSKNTILYIWNGIREWIENEGGSKDFLRLLNGVPKFAVLILDEDIFFYPYGYKTSGVGSPMFLFRNNGCKEASFFIDFAEKLIKDSNPAGDVIKSWTA